MGIHGADDRAECEDDHNHSDDRWKYLFEPFLAENGCHSLDHFGSMEQEYLIDPLDHDPAHKIGGHEESAAVATQPFGGPNQVIDGVGCHDRDHEVSGPLATSRSDGSLVQILHRDRIDQ